MRDFDLQVYDENGNSTGLFVECYGYKISPYYNQKEFKKWIINVLRSKESKNIDYTLVKASIYLGNKNKTPEKEWKKLNSFKPNKKINGVYYKEFKDLKAIENFVKKN